MALSDGSGPRRVYAHPATEELASQVSWPSVHVFRGGERWVRAHQPNSKYGMAREMPLGQLAAPYKARKQVC